MNTIIDQESFDPVPLLEVGEKVEGGEDGSSNKQAIALANRTNFLKKQLESLADPTTALKVDVPNTAARLALPQHNDLMMAHQLDDGVVWMIAADTDPSIPENWTPLADSNKLNMVGTLESLADLDTIDTSTLDRGDGYFVDTYIAIWNGIRWVTSNNLLGNRGIELLGTWPDHLVLPDPLVRHVGDAYIWKNDVWILTPAPSNWIPIGLRGPEGKSAYQSWLDLGNEGTEEEWAQSLVGKSNYQLWLAGGNSGTLEDFFNTLKVQGDPGKSTYQLWLDEGNVGTFDDFLEAERGPQGLPGKNTYQLWLDAGNTGTFNDFLETQRGPRGFEGDPGVDGKNVDIRGSVPTLADLDAVAGEDQACYSVIATRRLYRWKASPGIWEDLGFFIGENGQDGADGKDTYQLWLDAGNTGTFEDYLATQKGEPGIGIKGDDGVSLIIKDVLATYADLPVAPAEQDCYAILDENAVYIYINAAWKNMGVFKGDPGQDGASIDVIKVLTEEDQTIPDATVNAGKAYIDLDAVMWVAIGGVWKRAGRVTRGDKGETGAALLPYGVVNNVTMLPDPSVLIDGVGYFTADDKMLYVVENGLWTGPFDITGLKGDKGDKGDPGASVTILGAYETAGELTAAHPTGSLGDGYLVGTHLYTWSTVSGGTWIDVGEVKGPPGPEGPEGIGKPGPKGDRGSRWIALPAGVETPPIGFEGNVGDWAVSDTFRVYYCSAANGWEFWGIMMAGDVNSPLLSAGKVVRLGTSWVPLLVDEVPSLVDGKLYVRARKAGIETLGEWRELDLTHLERYDLAILAGSTELDLSKSNVFSINNSSAVTISFKAGTVPASGRSMAVILIFNGLGAVTWPAGIVWADNAEPPLGNTLTVVTLLWDGINNRWIGNPGAKA